EIVAAVIEAAADGATASSIIARFEAPAHPAVRSLIAELRARRILVTGRPSAEDETPEDVFYWHFDLDYEDVGRALTERPFVIIGVNRVTERLMEGLRASGAKSVTLLDDPLLRGNADAVAAEAGEWAAAVDPQSKPRVVITSEFGGHGLLRDWNRFCVERGLEWMPVVLDDVVARVGPIVIPGRTACLECVRARQNANAEDLGRLRVIESDRPVAASHPILAAVAGEVAAFELLKAATRIPRWQVGTMIEISLLVPSLVSRKVLRLPRCLVCSSLNRSAPVTLKKSVFYLE
ncbi:MAG: hypothetical protein QOE68_3214, partial [Thermoanaerobaculia bacterium]|nr:hypothetical protein [Thermoanaerobaculia bacterium]